jgi:hypothetical protein
MSKAVIEGTAIATIREASDLVCHANSDPRKNLDQHYELIVPPKPAGKHACQNIGLLVWSSASNFKGIHPVGCSHRHFQPEAEEAMLTHWIFNR